MHFRSVLVLALELVPRAARRAKGPTSSFASISGNATISDSPQAKLDEPFAFAREQSQAMVLLNVASRAICLFSEHVVNAVGRVEQAFGGALMLQVGATQ